jgi:hypothetical protein
MPVVEHSLIEADFQALTTAGFMYGAPLVTSLKLQGGQDVPQSDQGMISYAEVQTHNSATDCWVIVNVCNIYPRREDWWATLTTFFCRA